jgi:hypothetical protein
MGDRLFQNGTDYVIDIRAGDEGGNAICAVLEGGMG